MVVSVHEKVHVITRRHFNEDLRRHFAGEIQEIAEGLIRVLGYAFIYDQSSGGFVRRRNKRVRVFSLTDAGLVVNVLPDSVDLENLRYEIGEAGQRVITDGRGFQMNVSKFGASL